jgi:hypothetical protein
MEKGLSAQKGKGLRVYKRMEPGMNEAMPHPIAGCAGDVGVKRSNIGTEINSKIQNNILKSV